MLLRRTAVTDDIVRIPKAKYLYRAGTGWGFMRFMDIPDLDTGLVYLRRFIIFKTPWIALYLHWIYMPDHDQDPHNHPFGFLSMVLRGGYVEQRYRSYDMLVALRSTVSGLRERKRWSVARTTLQDFHQIRTVEPGTLTLVLCGPRKPDWGFLTTEGYESYKTYEKSKTKP